MGELIAVSIIVLIIAWLVIEFVNGMKSGANEKNLTAKQKRQYIKEKIAIDNEFCSGLPPYDSRGIFTGISGSATDNTGKFDPLHQQRINELNKKYGYMDEDK